MGNRVMGWLAAVSMNYYLLHQNLAVHLKRLGVPPSVSAEPNRAGEQPWQLQYTLLCFGLSLLGAALITLLIEKPCAKVLKRCLRVEKRKTRRNVLWESADIDDLISQKGTAGLFIRWCLFGYKDRKENKGNTA